MFVCEASKKNFKELRTKKFPGFSGGGAPSTPRGPIRSNRIDRVHPQSVGPAWLLNNQIYRGEITPVKQICIWLCCF